MRKVERQQHLRQLIVANNIEKQEDFVKLLKDENIKVTQATVSRDIKEMQLVKVPSVGGGYHYSLPAQRQMDSEKKLKRTLQDAFIEMDSQDKMVVIHVQPGNGPALATLISQVDDDNIFATLGDDSTVLTICKTKVGVEAFTARINELLVD